MRLLLLAALLLAGCKTHLEQEAQLHGQSQIEGTRDEHHEAGPVDIDEEITETIPPTPATPTAPPTPGKVTQTKRHTHEGPVLADIKSADRGDYEVDAHTETEKDRAPAGIFAFLAGWWPYLLAAIPVLVVVFRKRLLALLTPGLKG